jgi:hypothetical protein
LLVEESCTQTDLRESGNTVHDNCVHSLNPDDNFNQHGRIMPNAEGFTAYDHVEVFDPM